MYYKVNPRYQLIILGNFPNARYFAITTNDDHNAFSQYILDADIVPSTSSYINPFLPNTPFVAGQQYIVPINFGGVPGTLETGCMMTGLNVDVNGVDATQRHQGINWNTDAGVFQQLPNFPLHIVDTPEHTNPPLAGSILIRAYLPEGSQTAPYLIVRDVASGCAYPAAYALQTLQIVTNNGTTGSSWVDNTQYQAHLSYNQNYLPQFCYGTNPQNALSWSRSAEFGYLDDPPSSYIVATLPSGLPATLAAAGAVMRFRLRIPATPPTPCTNGCSRSGNEQIRFMDLSFRDTNGYLASLADSAFTQDSNGYATLIVGTGATIPSWITPQNGYTFLNLTAVSGYQNPLSLIIRNILPSGTFACPGHAVPYNTTVYTPQGGLMGDYLPVVDYPTAASLPPVASELVGPNACGVFPVGQPAQAPNCGVVPSDPIAITSIPAPTPTESAVAAQPLPPVTISGDGFGLFPNELPYTGNSNYLQITDLTQAWSAGYTGSPCNVSIGNWTSGRIELVANVNQNGACPLAAGDQLIVSVSNPQTMAGPVTAMVTVAPTTANMSYALGSSSALVGSAAGNGTVLLTASGPWTASSNASWLQIAPGSASGVGGQLIQFSYSANYNPGAQTGTLTIAGLTFTVTQAGTSFVSASPVTTLVSSGLNSPQGVAVDSQGDVYVADTANNAIKEWNAVTQQITGVVSSGLSGPTAVVVDAFGNVYLADSGNNAIKEWMAANQQVATLVSGLSNPSGVAVDGQGNVYFSNTGNNSIEEWSVASHQLTTLAGSGLSNPKGVAVDGQGNVYFADSGNNTIKEWVAAGGQVTALVSSGLNNPTGVAVDGQGNVYLADTGNNAIKQWNAGSQQIATLASAGLNGPAGTAVDALGNVYIADTGNNAIKQLTLAYVALSATTRSEVAQAGTDSVTAQVLPAGTPLTAASDQTWLTITSTAGGVIGFAFQANTSIASRTAHIMVLNPQVTVTQSGDVAAGIAKSAGDGQGTLAGQAFPVALQVTVTDASGSPVQGASVMFSVTPGATGASGTFNTTPQMPILTDQNGNAVAPALVAGGIAGQFTVTASVNSLAATFTLNNIASLTTFALGSSSVLVGSAAGNGTVLLIGNGPWTAVSNASWLQLTAGSAGGIGNAEIQFTYNANPNPAAQTGTLTIAGLTFNVTQAGVNYVAVSAVTTLVSSGLNNPQGVAVDALGNVYVADTANNVIKEWSPGAQQTVVLCTGFNNPGAVAVDRYGNVYIADSGNNAIEQWSSANQQMTTLVSGLSNPSGVAVDGQGNVYFSDTGNNTIEEWNAASQQVTALVNWGLSGPTGIAVDAEGNVYFADSGNSAIKEWVVASGQLVVLASTGLNNPTGLAVDGQGNVYISDTGNNAVKQWNAATQQVATLFSSGLNSPYGVAVDGSGNLYIADTFNSAIGEMPFAFVGPASMTEPVSAGSDSLLPVLPSTASLVGVFAPTSDQAWLTIGAIANGVVNFSFTANTSTSAQTAHINILGQQITVTQNGLTAQTITFLPLSNLSFGAAPFTVSAISSSGLAVSFASTTSTICTVSGATVTLAGAGACTIQAMQAGNTNYAAATPVNQSFQVTQASQTIAFGALSNQPFGAAPFTIGATASSGLAVSLASTTPAVCTVSGATVTLAGLGACTIQATQPGNTNYAAATPINQSFQVTQGSQTIAFGALSNQPYGTAPFTVSATASSGLTVSFNSQTTKVCTLSGTTVTLVALGTCTIQATQAGNSNWAAATPVNQSFQVTQGSQTIAFGALSNQPFGTAPFTVSATASSGLTVSFNSQTTKVCTLSGTTVTLVGGGTCTIQATQAGNTRYAAATPVNQSFQVTQESQTIAFGALSNQPFGSAPFTVSATASSGLTVSFNSQTTKICTVSGTTVTLVAGGTCTVQATQAGNTRYAAAPPVNQSFQVTQESQTITFRALSNQAFGSAPFKVSATASSGLTVGFNSQTTKVCTVSGTTVTLVAAGACTVQATQAGNTNWAAATPVNQSFQVTQGSQTITFGALSNQPFGSTPFKVTATASSGLTVSFNSQTTKVCTVSGTTVTLVSLGACTIQATQAGNTNWAAAAPVNQSFQVTQGSQTIAFGALSNQLLGSAPFKVSATASSGLTVSFNSQTKNVCTVSGTTVTLVASGTCTIQATQAGNTNWAAAAPVNQGFQVTP
jgi:sugar lactone lactonase YvrE